MIRGINQSRARPNEGNPVVFTGECTMKSLFASTALVLGVISAPGLAAPTNLSTWAEDGSGNWVVAGDNNSVNQTLNGDPAVFYSDFNSLGRKLSGTITVNTNSDDDFIGFVVGYNPGDLSSAASNFIVIDWKQLNQGSFGCNADIGLAVSRATAGLGNNAGAWCHEGNGVTELARGSTLGATGWQDARTYTFDIEYTANNLKVFVDGALEINLNGAFTDGRFGFYNYSQANVTYAGITDDVLPPAIPEPTTWAMMIGGFGLVGAATRRRSRAGNAHA